MTISSKIAFIRIPKTASRSIRDTGLFLCGGHKTFEETKEQYDFEKVFCVCRNPYDRVYSVYNQGIRYLAKSKWPYFPAFKLFTSFENFCMRGISYFRKNKLEVYQEGEAIKTIYHPHFFSQTYWIKGGSIDRILRFEKLEEEWESLCSDWGIPFQPLPHNNASKNKKFTEVYNETTAENVYQEYIEDFRNFNYSKDSWR